MEVPRVEGARLTDSGAERRGLRAFDTHAHFDGGSDATAAALERAYAAGVFRVMAVGGDLALNAGAREAKRIAAGDPHRFPQVFTSCGLDRDQTQADGLPPFPDFATADAVGEIGLDYHFGAEDRDAQRRLFAAQLDAARSLGKSVIVHTRDADDDTLALLRETPSKGIIHSFTGTPDFCRRLLDFDFFISISGIVTFKSADNVRETALAIPGDRLLVETDSPYLAPVPMRGRRNEPAFVVHTLEFLAKLRGADPAALAEETSANAARAFGLPT